MRFQGACVLSHQLNLAQPRARVPVQGVDVCGEYVRTGFIGLQARTQLRCTSRVGMHSMLACAGIYY